MIFLLILTILIIIIQIFMTLNIKIEIQNLELSFPKCNKKDQNKESKILLKIYIMKKIKISEIDLKKIKTSDEKIKNRINNFKNNIRTGFKKNIFSKIIKINYKIENIDLKIILGLEDAAITAISIGIVSTVIFNLIKEKIEDKQSVKIDIKPYYYNVNFLKIDLDGIFTLNIANIIDIIKFLRKGRVNTHVRTSYRRPYAYSNE